MLGSFLSSSLYVAPDVWMHVGAYVDHEGELIGRVGVSVGATLSIFGPPEGLRILAGKLMEAAERAEQLPAVVSAA